ncbi:glycosyltransferase (plasmid) [Rahnella variigena]|uniref:glycosyltransferase n=1 Tax=Rahnella variigena TaxID=574964 RepID=UPI003CEE3689
MPEFSVLMSLYNKEDPSYLLACLKSLSKQTLMPTEVVIVFDGPIDSALEDIVDEFKVCLNILIFRLQENVGLGNALNYGLKHCNYDLVARMDTDDICLPHRFELQLSQFQRDPELALLGSSIIEFSVSVNNIIGQRSVPISSADIREHSKRKNPFNHMSVVFRKNVIFDVGGYIHHPLMEDYNLWLRVICSGYLTKNLAEPLVKARVGRDMLKRRSGFNYIKSEYQLALLKHELKLQGRVSAVIIFFMRSIPRVLPLSLLSGIYKFNRKLKKS